MTGHYSDRQQWGFTLLEMVLVLLIMSMVASLSVVFIDNEDNQLRYEETIQKLEAMHKATVKVKEYGSDFLFSGFVVDNGVLPSAAKDYAGIPADWIERTLFDSGNQPKYRIDEADSYSGLDNVSLYKGYRVGYISTGVDSDGDYKTGWGEDFTVDEKANHSLNLTYDSTFNPSDYGHLMNKDVAVDSWSIALSEINTITIKNGTLSLINSSNYLVAIAVFKNTATTNDSDRWKTFHAALAINGMPVDMPVGASQTFLLSWLKDDASATTASAERIPAGEHPIFIVEEGNHAIVKDQAILKVIPRFTQPNVTLVID